MNIENKKQPRYIEKYRGQILLYEAQKGILRLSSFASLSGLACMALEDRADARIELFTAVGTLATAGVLFLVDKIKQKR